MSDNVQIGVYRSAKGGRDWLRSYTLELDGWPCARVKGGEEAWIDVEPGWHTLQARIDWSGSPPLDLDVKPGSVVRLRVEPAGASWQFWQAFGRTSWLRLTVERPPNG